MVLVSTLLIYNSDSNISFILPWIKTWESETGFLGYKLRSWLRIILSYMSLNHYCMGIYEITNQIIIISIQKIKKFGIDNKMLSEMKVKIFLTITMKFS